MIKRFLYIFLLSVYLVSCKPHSKNFVIEGTLPSSKYNGEWIFLVPAEGASFDNVDSVKVSETSFVFKGNVERMAIIRTKPLLRLQLQELLVVTEPGTIRVKIDSVSSAYGTPQNDALQLWKEQKEKTLSAYRFISKLTLSGEDSVRWQAQKDTLMQKERMYTERFLKEQGNNTVGKFIREMTGDTNK